jgi:hypothetical protein
MKGLCIGVFARLAELNEECTKLMVFGRFSNRLQLIIVSTDDAAVFDHDILAPVFRHQLFLVVDIELELGLEGEWHGSWHNIDTKAVRDKQGKPIFEAAAGRARWARGLVAAAWRTNKKPRRIGRGCAQRF